MLLGQAKPSNMEPERASAQSTFDAALGNTYAINGYNEKHTELLRLEKRDAWDREARPRETSRSWDDQTERRVALIIREIREYERKVTFGNLASEAIPEEHTRDMGGQFLTNKERIDTESKLYVIAKMVPKACLLHLHFNAELHPERLLEQAREMEHMYIRSIRPLLTQEDLDKTETVFTILDQEVVEPGVNIFSSDYPGGPLNWRTDEWKYRVWMPWKAFRDGFEKQFPHQYDQPADNDVPDTPRCCGDQGRVEPGHASLCPAENWLKSKMVLSEKEAYISTQTVNG